MKVLVLAVDTAARLEDEAWVRALESLPDEVRPGIVRYHRWQDRQNALMGRLLLLAGFNQFGLGRQDLLNLSATDTGKPYLDHGPTFNLSHTDGLTLCAFQGENEVGVDVERVRTVPFSDFEAVFSQPEWDRIRASSNPMGTFYEFWTLKESAMKLDGRGMQLDPRRIRIDNDTILLDESPIFVHSLPVGEDFRGCLASRQPIANLSFHFVTLGDLVV